MLLLFGSVSLGRSPLRPVAGAALQPLEEHPALRPVVEPDRASGDGLPKVVPCAIPVALGEVEESQFKMGVELPPTRRAGLR